MGKVCPSQHKKQQVNMLTQQSKPLAKPSTIARASPVSALPLATRFHRCHTATMSPSPLPLPTSPTHTRTHILMSFYRPGTEIVPRRGVCWLGLWPSYLSGRRRLTRRWHNPPYCEWGWISCCCVLVYSSDLYSSYLLCSILTICR